MYSIIINVRFRINRKRNWLIKQKDFLIVLWWVTTNGKALRFKKINNKISLEKS